MFSSSTAYSVFWIIRGCVGVSIKKKKEKKLIESATHAVWYLKDQRNGF